MNAAEQKIVFITGASRSGTTLLSFVLRNHSEVFGLKELHYFGDTWDPRKSSRALTETELVDAAAMLFARQDRGVFVSGPTKIHSERAAAFVAALPDSEKTASGVYAAVLAQFASEANKRIPCEQTPRYIFYAQALLDLYPNAHVVHMLRDPRAVMASQKNRWQRRKLARNKTAVSWRQSLNTWMNYHPYTVTKLWNHATRTALSLANHPRFMLVKFEDLLNTPEQTVGAICDRLDLQYDPRMLDVAQVNSSHQTAVGGARRGLQRESSDLWRQKLSQGEVQITEKLCGPQMDECGYERTTQQKGSRLVTIWYGLTGMFHVLGILVLNPHRALIQAQALWSRGQRVRDASPSPIPKDHA